nr:MAG TPA: hypothetical protein [Caudoviricetes sp.]
MTLNRNLIKFLQYMYCNSIRTKCKIWYLSNS